MKSQRCSLSVWCAGCLLLGIILPLNVFLLHLRYYGVTKHSENGLSHCKTSIKRSPEVNCGYVAASFPHPNFAFSHGHIPDPTCPRFIAHRAVTDAGVGHMMTEFISSLIFAIDLPNATFVYEPPELWARPSTHGGLGWAESFFRLDYGEAKIEAVTQKFGPRVVDVKGASCKELFETKCNILCIRTFHEVPGPKLVIEDINRAYERLKHVMRVKFRQSRYQTLNYLFSKRNYNVAWHLRVGDIAPFAGNTVFLRTAIDTLQALIADIGLPIQVYFFAEAPEAGNGPPLGFKILPELLPNAIFVNDCNASDTLFHFAHADMVISHGSSFSLLSPLMSPKPLVLSTPPKEGSHISFYDTSETLKLDDEGHILGQTLNEARDLIRDHFGIYHNFEPHDCA